MKTSIQFSLINHNWNLRKMYIAVFNVMGYTNAKHVCNVLELVKSGLYAQ